MNWAELGRDQDDASVLIFFQTNKRIGLNTTVHAPLSTLLYSEIVACNHRRRAWAPPGRLSSQSELPGNLRAGRQSTRPTSRDKSSHRVALSSTSMSSPHLASLHMSMSMSRSTQHAVAPAPTGAPYSLPSLDVSDDPTGNTMTLLRNVESVYFQSRTTEDEKNKMHSKKVTSARSHPPGLPRSWLRPCAATHVCVRPRSLIQPCARTHSHFAGAGAR